MTEPVKPFDAAVVGDEVYTWENDANDWGEYRFETIDPDQTGAWAEHARNSHDFGDEPVLIRKRWRLVEVVEIRPTYTPDGYGDKDIDDLFGDIKFVGTITVVDDEGAVA